MKTDYTPYIKGTDKGNRFSWGYCTKYETKTEMPGYWDKDNFITWIICGADRNAELPKVINYWEL